MKCPNCRGPLSKVHPMNGQVRRPKAPPSIYRCIVCGHDLTERIETRRTRRRLMSARKPMKLKLAKRAL